MFFLFISIIIVSIPSRRFEVETNVKHEGLRNVSLGYEKHFDHTIGGGGMQVFRKM